ncbi:MAG: ABC transporter permease subunit, partial [Frankia sp.]|nr:ABC transporter permease subunit [Frankia sp.]
MTEQSAARRFALGVLGVVIVVGVWQAVAMAKLLGSSVSAPTEVLDVLTTPRQLDLLTSAASETAGEALLGFGWSLAAAVVAGVLVHVVPPLRRGVDQLATIESAIPFVALAPILLATVGRDAVPAGMAATTAFFPLYIAVVSGLAAVPSAVGDVFSVFGASRRQRMLRAAIPAGIPVVASGLKVGMPLAIVGAVVGEWFGGSNGVGPMMLVAMRNYRMELMWATVVVT